MVTALQGCPTRTWISSPHRAPQLAVFCGMVAGRLLSQHWDGIIVAKRNDNATGHRYARNPHLACQFRLYNSS